jgi:flagellar biosynthesis protein FlhB
MFVPFYILLLILELVDTGFGELVRSYFPLPKAPELTTATPQTALPQILQWFSALIATLIVILALTFIISWIIGSIVYGTAIKCTDDLLEKGSSNLKASFSLAILRLPSLLAVGIITGVLIVIGLICLIVPGIIIAIMFALVIPVIMIEQIGALDSLGRSRRLVSRRWGKTFATILLVGIIVGILAGLGSAIGSLFGPASFIVESIIAALVAPIYPIALTFLYYSMVAKEAALAVPPPPAPPLSTVPPAVPSVTETAPSLRFCVQCGRQISQDVKFCPYCGKEMESS